MIEIKAGYLIELKEDYETESKFYIVIELTDGLNLFEIEKYYDETLQLCHKISIWFCNVISLKHYDVLNVYGLCNNGRLTDIGNRELLWENVEVLA